MTRNEAKLELFKLNRNIEKLIVEHANELGQHNKNCVLSKNYNVMGQEKIFKKYHK